MAEVGACRVQEGQSVDESVKKFEAMLTPEQRKAIERRISKLRNYSPRIGVFGKTGAGKSSLCNALFSCKRAQSATAIPAPGNWSS